MEKKIELLELDTLAKIACLETKKVALEPEGKENKLKIIADAITIKRRDYYLAVTGWFLELVNHWLFHANQFMYDKIYEDFC